MLDIFFVYDPTTRFKNIQYTSNNDKKMKSITKWLGIKKDFSVKRSLACGAEWARTTDSRIFSPMLYQLSYSTSETDGKHKTFVIHTK